MAREATASDPKGLSITELVEALRLATGNDDEAMKRRAEYEAEAHARLNKRENEYSPGLSVYSFPEGDRKAAEAGKFKRLKCDIYWVGEPLDVDTLTPTEVDLLNEAIDGEFLFHRTDGSPEKLTVKGERSATGQWKKLEFLFPCRDQHKHNLPSMVSILREAFGLKTAEQVELDALRALLAEKSLASA